MCNKLDFQSETTEFGTNFPAQLCPASVQLADTVRLTFNNPNPLSLLYKDVSFTPVSDSGQAIGPAMVVPWADKRDTHPKGWLALLPINKTYLMEFVGMERITNFSYVGTIWGLKVCYMSYCTGWPKTTVSRKLYFIAFILVINMHNNSSYTAAALNK